MKMKIKDVPNGSIFEGVSPFTSEKGEKFIKCENMDGNSWVLSINDWTVYSIPEDCFDLEVEAFEFEPAYIS